MSQKSRLVRRLVPRFGIAWIFVGMLLCISAAGWWTFHRDLYVEEIDVIRSLKKSAGKVTVRRSDLVDFQPGVEEDFDGEIPWNSPLLPSVERIYVEGELPDDVRDAAARLPRLESLSIRPDWQRPITYPRPSGPFDFEEHLGRPLPQLPVPTLSAESVSAALPEGEEVGPEEAERVARAIYEAWRDEEASPTRFLVVTSNTPLIGGNGPEETVHLVEPGRRFHFYKRHWTERAVFLSNEVRHDVDRQNGPWQRESRDAEAGVERDDEVFRRFPEEDFPYLGQEFHGVLTISRALEAMPTFEFDRIAKIDDARFRVDFKPFTASMDEDVARFNVIDPQVTEWNFVLRSDLDWAPEESNIVQRIQQTSWPAPRQYERRLSQRYRREGEHVLLTERMSQESSGPADNVKVGELSQHVYAYDVDPDYDERIFDPVSLDPEPWPERRELPWLRWYRATFLLGCGLAAALIARRVRSTRSRTSQDSDVADGPDEADDRESADA